MGSRAVKVLKKLAQAPHNHHGAGCNSFHRFPWNSYQSYLKFTTQSCCYASCDSNQCYVCEGDERVLPLWPEHLYLITHAEILIQLYAGISCPDLADVANPVVLRRFGVL